LVCIPLVWYVVPCKIWQPWYRRALNRLPHQDLSVLLVLDLEDDPEAAAAQLLVDLVLALEDRPLLQLDDAVLEGGVERGVVLKFVFPAALLVAAVVVLGSMLWFYFQHI
jgi:hypothetical protein